MAPAQLSDLTGRLASIWIADLNHPDGRPDRRLALIDASVIETVPAPETFTFPTRTRPVLLGRSRLVDRRRHPLAVAAQRAVRRYVEALIDDVVDLAPAMRARISLHPAGCRRLGLHQVAQWGGSADPRRIHG